MSEIIQPAQITQPQITRTHLREARRREQSWPRQILRAASTAGNVVLSAMAQVEEHVHTTSFAYSNTHITPAVADPGNEDYARRALAQNNPGAKVVERLPEEHFGNQQHTWY